MSLSPQWAIPSQHGPEVKLAGIVCWMIIPLFLTRDGRRQDVIDMNHMKYVQLLYHLSVILSRRPADTRIIIIHPGCKMVELAITHKT